MKENIKIWWEKLNHREQFLVGYGSLIVIVMLLYLFVWSPFTSSLTTLKHYVTYQENLFSWMQQASQKLKLSKASNTEIQKVSSNSLLSTLDTILKKNKIDSFVKSMQETDANTVLVKFNKVPFDYLISCMSQLWMHYQIKVERIEIIPNKQKNGLVNTDVYFKLITT